MDAFHALLDPRDYTRPRVTPTNLAPIVVILTWVLLSAMVLSLTIRWACRQYLIRQNGPDDWAIVVAVLFAVAQSLCVAVPSDPIWGRRIDELSRSALDTGLKLQYIGNFFFYASLCITKISVLVGFGRISTLHRALITGVCVASVVWAVTTEFLLAFQCPLPDPWNFTQGHCRSRLGIYLFASIGNIVTDIAIVLIPLLIIAPLRVPLRKRAVMASLLCTRLLVIIATAVQIGFLRRSLEPDFTFQSFPYSVAKQTVQALSIITSSMPFFLPFMRGLQSDLMFTDSIGVPGLSSRRYSEAGGYRTAAILSFIPIRRNS